MEVKVVTGANYGDCGKGLVSGCLAREAAEKGHKVLTVFYNGTGQRAHDFEGVARHFTAAGENYGSDTFYHRMFVVDPIMLWLSKTTPIIDPRCRIIFPCDVLYGQSREKQVKHGSCGFGLFAAVKRFEDINSYPFEVNDIFLPAGTLFPLIQKTDSYYKYRSNEIHNLTNFIQAIKWVKENCQIIKFGDLVNKNIYDTVIFEGGQGLLLDQANKGDFPHLTPSSTGAFNIQSDISTLFNVPVDLFYVSRSYITRHGQGPMDKECAKEAINPAIIDLVNQPNEWQGNLRFGLIDTDKLNKRILGDAAQYHCEKTINMVYTHLNYTDNKIASINGNIKITKPDFVTTMWGSNKKDFMEKIDI